MAEDVADWIDLQQKEQCWLTAKVIMTSPWEMEACFRSDQQADTSLR